MRVVSAGSKRRAIVAEVKIFFRLREGVDIEAVGIKIICERIRREQINSGREACFSANFQQTLEYFKGSKTANRIPVSGHDFQHPPCNARCWFQLLPCFDVTSRLAFVHELELKIGSALFDVSNQEKVPNTR